MMLYFTGASGQVGRALAAVAEQSADSSAVGFTRADLDLSGDAVDLFSLFPTPPPRNSVLINLAAFTNVDGAEDPSQRDQAHTINGVAPGELAKQARELGMPMIQVSTDYVFSGRRKDKGCNAPTDQTGPINVYGASKLAGEVAAMEHGAHVVRTSWVYSGPENAGGDFVKTMTSLADRGVDPSVVDDQWGRPTYAAHLAEALWEVGLVLAGEHSTVEKKDLPQILHCAGSGDPITWKDLACATFAQRGADPARVTGIPTSEYPTPAERPLNATLCLEQWAELGLRPLPAWQDGLTQAMQ